MNKIDICKSILQSVKDYISSEDCLATHRFPNHFIRNRKLSLPHVVNYLLYSSNASMYQNLASIIDDFGTDSFPNVSKQAVSKARQGIKPDLFQSLFQLSTDIYYSNIDQRKTWNGYHLFAIDGSKFQLPTSQSNFDEYGKIFSNHHHERVWSMALASMVYDVLDDYIVHASLNPYLASERPVARKHLEVLNALDIYQNSIVIFDRGYFGEKFFRDCISKGHICVMRLKEKYSLARSCHGDTLTQLKGDDKLNTEDISLRVIEVDLEDGTKEYLATNLFDTNITADMFKELYFLRWPIECKYYELKYRVDIEEFNGATNISVQQEFYINMLISNLASLIKATVDEQIENSQNPHNKYRYQANRTFIIGRLKKLFPKFIFGTRDINMIDQIVEESFKRRSQIQPNRKNQRPRIERRRKHFRNIKQTV